MKKLIIMTLFCLFVISTNAYAFFLPFDSIGWVNPSFNNSWNPGTQSGIARYFFYFDNPDVKVNELALQFEGDIFDLDQLDNSDFSIVAPSGWLYTMWEENTTRHWLLSGGTFINSNQDPIIVDVAYTLLASNRMYYGNNLFAGDPNVWSWNEAQGANAPWSQKYGLGGKIETRIGRLDAFSGGSTAPVPEPASILLLGTGILGLIGFNLRKKS